MSPVVTPLDIFVIVGAPFIGSWLATLALSWPQWPELNQHRSRCGACGVRLPVWRMIPIASWFLQRGRCAACASAISSVHPLMEAACLAGATFTVIVANDDETLAAAVFAWLLAYASAVDERTLELPDWSSAAILGFGLMVAFGSGQEDFLTALSASLLVAGALAGVRLVWLKVYRRDGLGLGDVKLAAACAAWTGPLLAAPAIAVAGAITLMRIALQPSMSTAGARIPFGSGIAAGFFIVWAIAAGSSA